MRRSVGSPRIPEAGTSSASSFNDQIRAGLLFLGDVITLRAKDPLLVSTAYKNSLKCWDFWKPWLHLDGCRRGTEEWALEGFLH